MHQELIDNPSDPKTWEQFRSIGKRAREQVIDELKQAFDQLIRKEPSAALAFADLIRMAARDTPSRLGIVHRSRAVAQHVNDQPELALEAYREAITFYQSAEDALEVAKLERALIDLHHMAGRNAEALDCAERARRTFQELGDLRQLAQLQVNLGNVHFRQDRLADAVTAGHRAPNRGDRRDAIEPPRPHVLPSVHIKRLPQIMQAPG